MSFGMKQHVRRSAVYVLVAMGLVVCLGSIWYSTPARLENMDSMLYCACGYSKVQFKNGTITMIKFHHDDVKPGDLIGTYSPSNQAVQLEIYWKGKTNAMRCEMDNVGVLASSGSPWQYQALDSRSWKPWIHYHLQRVF
jgi:hypothetical protein